MEVKTYDRRAEQGDRTRQQLLDAAQRLFSESGYAQTPIDQVVREAGVTKGALYHHFRDKTALFEEVLAERVRALGEAAKRASRERVQRQGRPRRGFDRMGAAVDVFLERLCAPATHRILLVDGPAVVGRERFERIWVANSLVGVRRILGPIADGPGLAAHRIEVVSRMLLGAMHEAAVVIAQADDPDVARREYVEAVAWMLEALHRQAAEDAARPTRPPHQRG